MHAGNQPHEQILIEPTGSQVKSKFGKWLLNTGSDGAEHQTTHWFRVMCLTGVDYFSTLGYQPAIAALAAGLLSPMATIILVLLTLFGALPVYRRVASESYRGEGSIALLEKLLPWWTGKLLVLVLLGFAATDFIITITLSAADASAHFIQNPFVSKFVANGQVPVTLILVAILGAVFLMGFKEAIGIAVALVVVYLGLNLVVIGSAVAHVVANGPVLVQDWWSALLTQHGNPIVMLAIALLVFPKLALGMSGFETGVSVMPQIRGDESDSHDSQSAPLGRIRGTKKLLTTAAITMSLFLISSSLVTTLLIPQAEFQPGGQANGRALAYIAHEYLGGAFGTAYDISTILILWFAGASAMAGLLNLVPRYLPRYGMAPAWAAMTRPLVIVFTIIAFAITLIFDANVDAQGGAYATGVLVLMASASLAATLSAKRKKQRFALYGFAVVTAIFVYTTIANVIERPDGVRIASFFIIAILVISITSRVQRSFQLRARSVRFDDAAYDMLKIDKQFQGQVMLIAHENHGGQEEEYNKKAKAERKWGRIPAGMSTIFLEVNVVDSSDFEEDLVVTGVNEYGYRILRVDSSSIPNAIAAVMLAIRDEIGVVPEIYFRWSEGNPVSNMAKFLITGRGEIATVAREVLRESEPIKANRPRVHVS
jgi:hypothetical protein